MLLRCHAAKDIRSLCFFCTGIYQLTESPPLRCFQRDRPWEKLGLRHGLVGDIEPWQISCISGFVDGVVFR